MVAAENGTVWKDSLRDSVDVARKVYATELSAVVQQEPVCRHAGVLDLRHVAADNIASWSDPAGDGRARIRNIDRLKLAATQQVTVGPPSSVRVPPDDFSLSVDPLSISKDGAGEIDSDKRQRSGRSGGWLAVGSNSTQP